MIEITKQSANNVLQRLQIEVKHSKNVKKIVLEALKIKSNVHARYKKFTECIQRSKTFPYR